MKPANFPSSSSPRFPSCGVHASLRRRRHSSPHAVRHALWEFYPSVYYTAEDTRPRSGRSRLRELNSNYREYNFERRRQFCIPKWLSNRQESVDTQRHLLFRFFDFIPLFQGTASTLSPSRSLPLFSFF